MAMQELNADWYNSNYQDLCSRRIPVGRTINLFTEAGEFTVPFNFIGNTRKDKIKRPKSDCKDGGLLMPHINHVHEEFSRCLSQHVESVS